MSRSFELSRRLFLIGASSAVATAAVAGTPSSLILPGVAPIIRKQVTSLSLPDGVHQRNIAMIYMSGNNAANGDGVSTVRMGRPESKHPMLEWQLQMAHSVMWRADPGVHEVVLTKQAPVLYIEWERVPRHGGVIMLGTVDHLLPAGDWRVRQGRLHTFRFAYDGAVFAEAVEKWSLDEAEGLIMRNEDYWGTRDRHWPKLEY